MYPAVWVLECECTYMCMYIHMYIHTSNDPHVVVCVCVDQSDHSPAHPLVFLIWCVVLQMLSKRGQYEGQLETVREQTRSIHNKLQTNQEDIARTHKDIGSSVSRQSDPFALRQYIDVVMEMEKLRVESSHNWVQVKALHRYVSSQEKEMQRKERCVDMGVLVSVLTWVLWWVC